jgi:hypothetical protein
MFALSDCASQAELPLDMNLLYASPQHEAGSRILGLSVRLGADGNRTCRSIPRERRRFRGANVSR